MLQLEKIDGGHLVQTLLKQGHLEPVAQDDVQTASECVQRWRLHHPSEQPVPVLSQPQKDKVVPDVLILPLGTSKNSLALSSLQLPFRHLHTS